MVGVFQRLSRVFGVLLGVMADIKTCDGYWALELKHEGGKTCSG